MLQREAAANRLGRGLACSAATRYQLDRIGFSAELSRMSATTLDPAEIAKFNALAADWWNPKGPFGALHRLNPVRLQFVRDFALRHFGGASARPLKGLNVLDLGCGGGLVSIPLARMGADVLGVDAAPEAVGAARAYAERTGVIVTYENTSAEALVERGARFDLVTALEIVEHVSDVNAFLEAAAALVKPGGALVLSTINRTPKARALAIVGAERILKWAPEGAHDYDKLVTPEEIRGGAPTIKWEEPVGITYAPLGAGWSLTDDISVNYMIAGIRPERS